MRAADALPYIGIIRTGSKGFSQLRTLGAPPATLPGNLRTPRGESTNNNHYYHLLRIEPRDTASYYPPP